MKKFEYKITRVEKGEEQKLLDYLNDFGKDGWELVHMKRYFDATIFIFKKEI